jgi:hypothetical protein
MPSTASSSRPSCDQQPSDRPFSQNGTTGSDSQLVGYAAVGALHNAEPQDVQGAHRQELRPDDARMAGPKVPAFIQGGFAMTGQVLDHMQGTLEVATVDGLAHDGKAPLPVDQATAEHSRADRH